MDFKLQPRQHQFLFLVIPALLSWAGPAGATGFPATGQTTVYTAEKNDDHITGAVPVPDDGAVQAGVTLSFTDNGDGTITDNNTGLMWEKKGDNGGLHDKDNSYYWTGNTATMTIWDWLDAVNLASFGGAQDWRIPNARELLSLASFDGVVPAAFNNNCVAGVSAVSGSCTKNLAYWTSTSDVSTALSGTTITAWYVMNAGLSVGTVYPDFKSDATYVRAVRGGTP